MPRLRHETDEDPGNGRREGDGLERVTDPSSAERATPEG
jgi:hypothetical protein